jgi:Mrp family chromosome partitioning ATPase
VSYIVERIARDLRISTGERVLIVAGRRLNSLLLSELKQLDNCTTEMMPGVLVLSDERSTSIGPFAPVACEVLLDALRKDFGYVLIDCAAMSEASEAVSFAIHTDGTLLVIAAGQTRLSQVEQAQKLIETASGRLLGCVLNKRTYPIPQFLYKRL